jgi:hypothetical protein
MKYQLTKNVASPNSLSGVAGNTKTRLSVCIHMLLTNPMHFTMSASAMCASCKSARVQGLQRTLSWDYEMQIASHTHMETRGRTKTRSRDTKMKTLAAV